MCFLTLGKIHLFALMYISNGISLLISKDPVSGSAEQEA